ncbi:7274_t:CDS:2 [Funneliformis geosporum]|uniref:14731_t:CDS:1 n=1 Tax=Funneliformis geosporum TaxID=1117311 RepID=A0A9W4X3L9_9GLOM|nr:7274_t:CDS:2 [Funneliformis geosporum]CAI2184061.1 14731_t:CDS:2 [Funneliformis geosporum]
MFSPLFFWRAAAILGSSGIALGSYGAHGLQKRTMDQTKIKNWQTATNYQMIHSIALLTLSNVSHPATGRHVTFASSLMLTGVLMFSGSIYLLVLDKNTFKFLGIVTPIGGLMMLAGWGSLLL